MSILVFGSLNMDLMARVDRLPNPGETIGGQNFDTIPGGKGANQAVAAARLGAPTQMVGRVGSDAFGQSLIEAMASADVQTDAVLVDDSQHSGVALIAVAQSGENQIIVIPGANGAVNTEDLSRLQSGLSNAKLLLLQFEIPFEAVQAAATMAHQAGVRVMVDPAPAQASLPNEFYAHVDILTPNQTEASQLVGFEVCDRDTAQEAAQILHQRGVSTVIIKLGQQGVVVTSTEGSSFATPAFEVEAVDTVAAGDAFNGGLAVALAEDKPLKDAVRWASAVAALSVTQHGAQPSMPSRSQVDSFLEKRS